MSRPYLLAVDFDGTLAATMVDSPNGMNVGIACSKTIRDLFGERGLSVYNNQLGGLQNREPKELMLEMLSALEMTNVSAKEAAELFVAQKLHHLIPEISKEWPRLYPGVVDFFRDVKSGRYPLEVAIVSSGHREFIKRTFEVNGIEMPTNVVTSDEIRRRTQPDRPLFKPYPYQLAVAHREWRPCGLDDIVNQRFMDRDHGKDKMAYVGDDPEKDGELARRAGIPYVHVPFTHPGFIPNINEGQVGVKDFNELLSIARVGFSEKETGSISEVLFKRPYSEAYFKPQSQEMLYSRIMSAYARR